MFASDTSFITTGVNLRQAELRLQHGLFQLSNWCNLKNLSINTSKTNTYASSKHPKATTRSIVDVKINGEQIKRVDDLTFLGVMLGENLKWQHHIHKVKLKIN